MKWLVLGVLLLACLVAGDEAAKEISSDMPADTAVEQPLAAPLMSLKPIERINRASLLLNKPLAASVVDKPIISSAFTNTMFKPHPVVEHFAVNEEHTAAAAAAAGEPIAVAADKELVQPIAADALHPMIDKDTKLLHPLDGDDTTAGRGWGGGWGRGWGGGWGRGFGGWGWGRGLGWGLGGWGLGGLGWGGGWGGLGGWGGGWGGGWPVAYIVV